MGMLVQLAVWGVFCVATDTQQLSPPEPQPAPQTEATPPDATQGLEDLPDTDDAAEDPYLQDTLAEHDGTQGAASPGTPWGPRWWQSAAIQVLVPVAGAMVAGGVLLALGAAAEMAVIGAATAVFQGGRTGWMDVVAALLGLLGTAAVLTITAAAVVLVEGAVYVGTALVASAFQRRMAAQKWWRMLFSPLWPCLAVVVPMVPFAVLLSLLALMVPASIYLVLARLTADTPGREIPAIMFYGAISASAALLGLYMLQAVAFRPVAHLAGLAVEHALLDEDPR